MTWAEEYEQKLDLMLRGRIARDFPLLERTQVECLARVLIEPHHAITNGTLRFVENQLGSTVATQKFLELYWPSLMQRYIAILDGRKRRDRRRSRRSARSDQQERAGENQESLPLSD